MARTHAVVALIAYLAGASLVSALPVTPNFPTSPTVPAFPVPSISITHSISSPEPSNVRPSNAGPAPGVSFAGASNAGPRGEEPPLHQRILDASHSDEDDLDDVNKFFFFDPRSHPGETESPGKFYNRVQQLYFLERLHVPENVYQQVDACSQDLETRKKRIGQREESYRDVAERRIREFAQRLKNYRPPTSPAELSLAATPHPKDWARKGCTSCDPARFEGRDDKKRSRDYFTCPLNLKSMASLA